MRGDERSGRRPHRGLWFGLILAAGMVRALPAQDQPDNPASSRFADRIVLAANRVTAWDAADGRWIHLYGDSAVLQGAEGIRARDARPRRRCVDGNRQDLAGRGLRRGPGPRGRRRGPSPIHLSRCVPNRRGPAQLLSSLGPDDSEGAALAVANHQALRIPCARAHRRRADAQATRAAHGAGARGPGRSCAGGARAGYRDANGRPHPGSAAERRTLGAGAGTEAGTYRPAAPKVDPMVQPAQFVGKPDPGLATTGGAMAPTDPQVQPTRFQQAPATVVQPPRLDLPPIERRAGSPGPEPHTQP